MSYKARSVSITKTYYVYNNVCYVCYITFVMKHNRTTSGKELFMRFTARSFRKLLSIYIFSYFPFDLGAGCRI